MKRKLKDEIVTPEILGNSGEIDPNSSDKNENENARKSKGGFSTKKIETHNSQNRRVDNKSASYENRCERDVERKEIEEYESGVIVNSLSEEKNAAEAAMLKAQKEEVASARKETVLTTFSYTWTVVSTLYAIVSICYFISKGWVETEFSYALIILLATYIVAFILIVVLTFNKPKKGSKHLKFYKKFLKIFKSAANAMLLILSVVSMAGIASESMTFAKWAVFALTFIIAVIQLALRISLLCSSISRKRLAHKYEVSVERFVNGDKQKKKIADKLREKSFKE